MTRGRGTRRCASRRKECALNAKLKVWRGAPGGSGRFEHEPRVALDGVVEELPELRRARGNRLAAELRKARLHVRRANRREHCLLEPRERLLRRLVGREEAEPGAELESREAAFRERRD